MRDNLTDPINLVVEYFFQDMELQEPVRQVEEPVRTDDFILNMELLELLRQRIIDQLVELGILVLSEPEPQNTIVCRCAYNGKWDLDNDPSNRIKDITIRGSTMFIVAYDVQGGSSAPMKVAKRLAKKKTHKGAKGGRGRERSISGGRDGEAIGDINRDPDPAPHIQKTGRPQVGFPFSQTKDGFRGGDESWDGLEREKGSGERDGGSMGGGQEEEVVPDIKRLHPTLHIERNRRPGVGFGRGGSPDELKWESGSESTCGGRDQERGESGGSEFRDEREGSGSVESRGRGGEGSGFGSECGDVKGEGSGSVESECRDAEEAEGSRSGANQDRDGQGEGSSDEIQGASGENQGGQRNSEESGSNDDEDKHKRQQGVGGDIEQGPRENIQGEIDFAGIPESFLTIIGATSVAAVEFHRSGTVSSTILSLEMAINGVGFLCCMTSMLLRHRKTATARISGTTGAAAAGFGFLLLVSVYFSSIYGWIILGLGTPAILVICGLAFFP